MCNSNAHILNLGLNIFLCVYESFILKLQTLQNVFSCEASFGPILILRCFLSLWVSVITRGVCFSLSGSVLRDHDRGETSPLSEVKRFPRSVDSESRVPEPWRDRVSLRKTISVDDRLLQQTPREHHRLLSRIERGKKKLRNINVSGRDVSYRCPIELSYRYCRKFHTGPGYKCALRCLFLAMSCLFTCTYSCV